MPETPAPGPGSQQVERIVALGGGETRRGLDPDRIKRLADSEPGRREGTLENASAMYFGAVDKYLGATSKRIADLTDQLHKLGPDTEQFVAGLDNLRHLSEKDFDRVAGRLMAKMMVEAASAQVKQGTEAATGVSDKVLQDHLDHAQQVWAMLTPRARAQVHRGLRETVTDGDLWERGITTLTDWTLHETFERHEHDSFDTVMTDTVEHLRHATRGFGQENYARGLQNLNSVLNVQITTESERILGRLKGGIDGLEKGIGILSAKPDAQESVQAELGRLRGTHEKILALSSGLVKADWQTDDLSGFAEMATSADTVIAAANAIIQRAGVRGKFAGASLEVHEVKGATKGTALDELAIKLAAGDEIGRQLGLLESDFRLRLGTALEIDLNTLIDKLPVGVGLKQLHEVLRARASEQLEVVSRVSDGEFGRQAKESLDIWLDTGKTVDERAEALRRLKSIGMDMKILGEYRADAADLTTQREPSRGLTKEMRAAWGEMQVCASEVHKLTLSLVPPEVSIDEQQRAAMGDFAQASLQQQLDEAGLAGNARDLYTTDGFRRWFVGLQKGRFGRWMREATSVFWGNRAPNRLTGVEIQEVGNVGLSGVAGRVAEGLTACQAISAAENPLAVAMAGNERSRTLHANTAFLLVRMGRGQAAERLRTILSKRPAVKGVGAEVTAAKLLTTPVLGQQAESFLGWELAGAAGLVAAPFVTAGAAAASKEAIRLLKEAAEYGRVGVREAWEWLQAIAQTTAQASVSGPDTAQGIQVAGEVRDAMNTAGANELTELREAWNAARNLAENQALRSDTAASVMDGVRGAFDGGTQLVQTILREPNELMRVLEVAAGTAGMAGVIEAIRRTKRGAGRAGRAAGRGVGGVVRGVGERIGLHRATAIEEAQPETELDVTSGAQGGSSNPPAGGEQP